MSLSPSSSSSTINSCGDTCRHLPIEISCLLTHFLEASPENKLIAIVIGKRKREVELVVSTKYVALTENKTFANVLSGRF